MDGIKGGGGKVGVGQVEDMAADAMNYCINHPYKNNNNGGICAFCLQEKLGKLVSSSTPLPLRASSSSQSPPDDGLAVVGGGGTSLSMSGDLPTTKDDLNVINSNNGTSHYQEYHTRRARNNIPLAKTKIMASSSSTTTTTSDHHHHHQYHDHRDGIVLKRSKSTAITRSTGRFWSFLYLSSKTQNAKKTDKNVASIMNHHDDDDEDDVRKVSRSRSVGCGSRSFSGDLFEKISTGFGDCTLRRVDSQSEPKRKHTINGGIRNSSNRKWTFASPVRAFSSKKDKNFNTTTTTPNLSAIPSLLAT